jgi:hypothetical protein
MWGHRDIQSLWNSSEFCSKIERDVMFDNRRFYIVKYHFGVVVLLGECRKDTGFGATSDKDPDKGDTWDVKEEKLQKFLSTTTLAFIEGVQDDEYGR